MFCSSHESVSYIPNSPFIFTNHNRFRYTADVFHSEYSIFWKLLFAALSNSSVNDRFLHHAVVPVFYFSI